MFRFEEQHFRLHSLTCLRNALSTGAAAAFYYRTIWARWAAERECLRLFFFRHCPARCGSASVGWWRSRAAESAPTPRGSPCCRQRASLFSPGSAWPGRASRPRSRSLTCAVQATKIKGLILRETDLAAGTARKRWSRHPHQASRSGRGCPVPRGIALQAVRSALTAILIGGRHPTAADGNSP